MIPQKIKDDIISELFRINSVNRLKFAARFRNSYIYLDVSEIMITSNFCKIEYSGSDEYIYVHYYNSVQSKYDMDRVKFRKDVLENNLELLFMKCENFR